MKEQHPSRFRATLFPLLTAVFVTALSVVAQAKTIPQTISTIDSALGDTARLAGKVVYVDFWASWCVPCQKSFPFMKSLLSKYAKSGFEIVAINVDPKAAPAKAFLDKYTAQFDADATGATALRALRKSVVFDSTGALAELYNLKAMPSTYIYGRDGSLKFSHRGFDPKDTLALDSTVQVLTKEEAHK